MTASCQTFSFPRFAGTPPLLSGDPMVAFLFRALSASVHTWSHFCIGFSSSVGSFFVSMPSSLLFFAQRSLTSAHNNDA